MKNRKLFLLILLVFLITACSNQEDVPETMSETANEIAETTEDPVEKAEELLQGTWRRKDAETSLVEIFKFDNGRVDYQYYLESMDDKKTNTNGTYDIDEKHVVTTINDHDTVFDYELKGEGMTLSTYITSGTDRGNSRVYYKVEADEKETEAYGLASREEEVIAEEDSASEEESSTEEPSFLWKIESSIDSSFIDTPHSVTYDDYSSAINIYFQAPESTRVFLSTRDEQYTEPWQNMADSMAVLGAAFLKTAQLGKNKAEFVNIYYVDKVNADNDYDNDDYLLWIQNGEEKFNYAVDSSVGDNLDVLKEYMSDNHESDSGAGSEGGSKTATTGERNALAKAHDYLEFMAFSYSGLIDQLEYEGFSTAEATYAVDNCGADWNEQAVKKAREYLDFMSFSRSGLIEQLEFEGFTRSQAEYGVDAVY